MGARAATQSPASFPHAASIAHAAERVRYVLLWLTGFSGAFVFVEPSPYEVLSVLTLVVFAASGMRLAAPLAPLALILIAYNVGFAIAVNRVIAETDAVIWVLISIYLSMTALFFAAMPSTNTQARLAALLRGYMAGAVVASAVAIAAYFQLFGDASAIFLLYERARGTFNDPNVLGAFLVLPLLLAFQRVLAGRMPTAIGAGALMLLLLAALFLSFSRGAWGQFALAASVLMGLAFVTTNSATERARIALFAGIGLLATAVFVVALLSIDQVAELFKERITLEQSYDVGYTGRFGRHVLGALMAIEDPFGLGPLQFRKFFYEDPHNVYLNAFLSGGWLAGLSYLALTAVTLVKGLRFAFAATPWRPAYQAIYAAYVGIVAESVVIDSDHWRHYFLVLGLVWGLMIVSRPYLPARLRTRKGPTAPAREAAPALARARPSA